MSKKDWFGIAYVSIWVVIWGTIGSIVDLPLLNSHAYTAGSLGQLSTFAITAALSIFIGVIVYPKVLNNTFVAAALGLDISDS